MEKNQVLKKLNENMQDLEIINNEISMIELAIYQKNIEEIKKQKLNEVIEFFEQQSKEYNQKSDKYQFEISRNIEKYKEQIDKLINVYNNIYINTFKIMQNAIDNQKIAIANIVILKDRLIKEEITSTESQKINNNIVACVQKKLNYAIIIDECKARIKWCIQNVQKDMNEIFINNIYQLQIYKENIFNKIRRKILNKISGKTKYKKVIENFENKNIRDIKYKNNLRVLDLMYTLKGIMKQMEKVKEQISKEYTEVVKK